ncbi:DUF2795 domain-containing protein [Thermoactinospora rubra]|uniref:DUF2795 domain-containing protein n=1 Tax=Thermoactinospora rubra TaxID=1088767 RepID=UPI000A112F50|nr:DUF2795 domain-containing protein [Thermoactinospora rubra]
MERGSAKHSPRLDEHQKQESEGVVRGGGPTHAEEWKEPEPMPAPGEEAPSRHAPGHEPGAPEGIDSYGVDLRSDIARWLSDQIFPASREDLVREAERPEMPGEVAQALRRVPEGQYHNVAQVAKALGLGFEERRW